MNETLITLSGNLVSDVTLRMTTRGDSLATFRIATTAKRYDRDSGRWVDADTCYFNVTAWRRAAENAGESLAKGHPVVVHGRVRQRVVAREVNGSPGTSVAVTYTDIEALSFGLDLSRCRARFERAPVGPQTTAVAPWAAGVPTEPPPGGGVQADAPGPVVASPEAA